MVAGDYALTKCGSLQGALYPPSTPESATVSVLDSIISRQRTSLFQQRQSALRPMHLSSTSSSTSATWASASRACTAPQVLCSLYKHTQICGHGDAHSPATLDTAGFYLGLGCQYPCRCGRVKVYLHAATRGTLLFNLSQLYVQLPERRPAAQPPALYESAAWARRLALTISEKSGHKTIQASRTARPPSSSSSVVSTSTVTGRHGSSDRKRALLRSVRAR
jgi:hypothetical protein